MHCVFANVVVKMVPIWTRTQNCFSRVTEISSRHVLRRHILRGMFFANLLFANVLRE